VARYGQGRNAEQVDINVIDKDGSERTIQVKPLKEEEIHKEWHV
jgi:tRNA-specific 2-thiouridylase